MDASNVVAHELESYGVRTFSAKEMAFNTLGLMHPLLFSITQVEPIWADLNGGMDCLPDLADITTRIRLSLNKTSELRRAIARDNAADFKIINGLEAERGACSPGRQCYTFAQTSVSISQPLKLTSLWQT